MNGNAKTERGSGRRGKQQKEIRKERKTETHVDSKRKLGRERE